METLGLCIIIAVYIYVDAGMFLRGYGSTFFKAKTEDEKKIQQREIDGKL